MSLRDLLRFVFLSFSLDVTHVVGLGFGSASLTSRDLGVQHFLMPKVDGCPEEDCGSLFERVPSTLMPDADPCSAQALADEIISLAKVHPEMQANTRMQLIAAANSLSDAVGNDAVRRVLCSRSPISPELHPFSKRDLANSSNTTQNAANVTQVESTAGKPPSEHGSSPSADSGSPKGVDGGAQSAVPPPQSDLAGNGSLAPALAGEINNNAGITPESVVDATTNPQSVDKISTAVPGQTSSNITSLLDEQNTINLTTENATANTEAFNAEAQNKLGETVPNVTTTSVPDRPLNATGATAPEAQIGTTTAKIAPGDTPTQDPRKSEVAPESAQANSTNIGLDIIVEGGPEIASLLQPITEQQSDALDADEDKEQNDPSKKDGNPQALDADEDKEKNDPSKNDGNPPKSDKNDDRKPEATTKSDGGVRKDPKSDTTLTSDGSAGSKSNNTSKSDGSGGSKKGTKLDTEKNNGGVQTESQSELTSTGDGSTDKSSPPSKSGGSADVQTGTSKNEGGEPVAEKPRKPKSRKKGRKRNRKNRDQ